MKIASIATTFLWCFLLAGCSGKTWVAASDPVLVDENHAVITFAKSSRKGREFFMIWEEEKFVGMLTPGIYIRHKVKPGRHVYIAHYGNKWALLEADLAAGREYLVRVHMPPFGRTRLDALKDPARAEALLNGLTLAEMSPEAEGYRKKYQPFPGRVLKMYRSGEMESYYKMSSDDHM